MDAAQAHRRSLSLGRRGNTRASRAFVPCRAGRGRLASYGSPLRQREAALLRHALVVRRESSDHAPRDPNAMLTTFEARAADLLRCWCGRARPTSWREAHSRWLTTQPRQVLTARLVLCARLADTPRGEKRAHRAPRDLNAMTSTTRNPCRRPVAVLARSSPGRRRGEDPCLAIAGIGSCRRARARAPSPSSGTRRSNELELSLAEGRSAGGSLTTAFQQYIHDAHTN